MRVYDLWMVNEVPKWRQKKSWEAGSCSCDHGDSSDSASKDKQQVTRIPYLPRCHSIAQRQYLRVPRCQNWRKNIADNWLEQWEFTRIHISKKRSIDRPTFWIKNKSVIVYRLELLSLAQTYRHSVFEWWLIKRAEGFYVNREREESRRICFPTILNITKARKAVERMNWLTSTEIYACCVARVVIQGRFTAVRFTNKTSWRHSSFVVLFFGMFGLWCILELA